VTQIRNCENHFRDKSLARMSELIKLHHERIDHDAREDEQHVSEAITKNFVS